MSEPIAARGSSPTPFHGFPQSDQSPTPIGCPQVFQHRAIGNREIRREDCFGRGWLWGRGKLKLATSCRAFFDVMVKTVDLFVELSNPSL